MASGWGLKGQAGRCFHFFDDFKKCVVSTSSKAEGIVVLVASRKEKGETLSSDRVLNYSRISHLGSASDPNRRCLPSFLPSLPHSNRTDRPIWILPSGMSLIYRCRIPSRISPKLPRCTMRMVLYVALTALFSGVITLSASTTRRNTAEYER